MILVAGAGAAGASVAYHLALLGARDVVLCDRGEVAGGATSKRWAASASSSRPATRCGSRGRASRSSRSSTEPLFEQVGYLFLATTEEGLAVVEERYEHQRSLGVAVERVDPSVVPGFASTTCSAPSSGARTASPTRPR